jgi:hypothetical protein
MICDGSVVGEPVVVPSDTSATVAVPLREPAVAVFMPTTKLVLFVAPGARLEKLPVAVRPDVAVEIEAFRPSAGAVAWLLIVSAWLGAVAPTRTLPRLTGFGVAALGCASWPQLTQDTRSRITSFPDLVSVQL